MTPQLTVERKKRTPDEPLIRTTSDVYTYWGERISAVVREDFSSPHIEKDSAIMRGDTCFHYGSHFPLASIIRSKNGRARLVLLNGDTYSGAAGWGSGTSARQAEVRNICLRECGPLDIPYFIVPFSALDAADIQKDTIVPLEIRSDTTEHRTRSSNERPGEYVLIDAPDGRTQMVPEDRWGYVGEDGTVYGSHGAPHPPDARWQPYVVEVEKPVKVRDTQHAKVEARPDANWWAHGSAELQSDGTWTWTEDRHRLGDSLFEATVRTTKDIRDRETGRLLETKWVRRRKVKFLSSYDYAEPQRPYFLCELPRTDAATVEEAFEALKPAEVLAAEAHPLLSENGEPLEVLRQGDVFAIPTTYTERELGQIAVMFDSPEGKVRTRLRSKHGSGAFILSTNHTATRVIVTRDGYYGQGVMYHDPGGWRQPDHRRVKLGDGKTWYRLVKNTVPIARTGMTHRAANVNQSGQSRAWTLGGMVD